MTDIQKARDKLFIEMAHSLNRIEHELGTRKRLSSGQLSRAIQALQVEMKCEGDETKYG